MGALDESGGGQEPVAMVGVGVKLKQHVGSAAAGHARGMGRQEAVHGIGRRGFRRGRGVRPGADVVEGQGLVSAGPRLLPAPARLRLLLGSHGRVWEVAVAQAASVKGEEGERRRECSFDVPGLDAAPTFPFLPPFSLL